MKLPLIVLCGPTASGKTRLSIDVAKALNGEIISADSMQIYRGMDIGTAKPTVEEMQGIPHHLIGSVGIGEEYSAAVFQKQARRIVQEIAERGKLPILCGGTGLFIHSVVYDLDFKSATVDEAYRAQLQTLLQEQGNQTLHDMLAEQDPSAAARIHPNNARRVIRALEIAKSGYPDQGEPSKLFSAVPLYQIAWLGLTLDRAALYSRIDARVDTMMAQGLLNEVKALVQQYSCDTAAFQALGYKELLGVLDGSLRLEDAVERIKQGTRNYAKRQMTWFKRESNIHWLQVDGYASYTDLLVDALGYIRSTLNIS